MSNWQLWVGILCGGLAGNLAKIAWDWFQGRKPRLYQHFQIDPIFYTRETSFRANVTVVENGENHDFEDLTMVSLTIKNKSKVDMKTFDFGLTLSDGPEIIYVEFQTSDRHHNAEVTSEVPKPKKPLNAVDVRIAPLNRDDEYVVKLYIHSPNRKINSSDIKISTPEPVRWLVRDNTNTNTNTNSDKVLIFFGPLMMSVTIAALLSYEWINADLFKGMDLKIVEIEAANAKLQEQLKRLEDLTSESNKPPNR
jgi:hypothetical protein